MKNILHIVSSARGSQSHSYGLSSAIVKKLQASNKIQLVVEKNLTTEPPNLIDEALSKEMYKTPEAIDEEGNRLLQYSETILNEIQEADIIVIGTPMHNFTISAHLKAWIDQFIRIGKTYKYNNDGTKTGLIIGKKVYLSIASGGIYPNWENEFIETYIKTVFRTFAGITDITTYRVEGTACANFEVNYDEIIQDLQ